MASSDIKRIMLVTGLSGAGKTTALKTMEDMGWETIDNFPIRLVHGLIDMPPPQSSNSPNPPLALGFDSRTRGFEPDKLIARVKELQQEKNILISTLYLDCNGKELERRYAETRRRHPLALDRPAADGIAQERAQLEPFRRWADYVIETSNLSENALQSKIRSSFTLEHPRNMTITLTSFGFSRGVPSDIDLLFDVRFLANPFWNDDLKLKTGQDPDVATYIQGDPSYQEAVDKFTEMLYFLLPRYEEAGKAYVNVGIGCTGGRHRSVHIAETIGKNLLENGFAPAIQHRNLSSRPVEALESMQKISKTQDI